MSKHTAVYVRVSSDKQLRSTGDKWTRILFWVNSGTLPRNNPERSGTEGNGGGRIRPDHHKAIIFTFSWSVPGSPSAADYF